jgi:hypothetical protein
MSRYSVIRTLGPIVCGVLAVSCAADAPSPLSPADAGLEAAWGPESPHFNLEVILRGPSSGFGHVKFRQPNDGDRIVWLDTWVRDLVPNHDYRLQRAVDVVLDGDCTSQSWLTLGEGLTPKAITTNATGTGEAALWRDLSAFPAGSTFDIHFRVLDDADQSVVLESTCYQFTISQ